MKRADIRRIAIVAMFSDDVLMERLVLKGGNALDLVHRLTGHGSLDIDFSIDGDFEWHIYPLWFGRFAADSPGITALASVCLSRASELRQFQP